MLGIETVFRRPCHWGLKWALSCAVLACLIASSCAGENRAAFQPSRSSAAFSDLAAGTSPRAAKTTVATGWTDDGALPPAALSQRVWPRTAAYLTPFSAADLFMSSAVRQLRLPLEGRELNGPFRGKPLERLDLESPVYDLCNDADAYEAYTGDKYSHGALFPGNAYTELLASRGEMGCDNSSLSATQLRWALRTNDWGGMAWFATRENALVYQQELIASYNERYANTVDAPAYGLHGSVSMDLLIRFAESGAPIDDVRLLKHSVTLVDGTLRGLVRNWSRELWAYEVTVTADGRAFEWPLSIQPGELAPFEFAAWSGSGDTRNIQFDVTARMAGEADFSRAFNFFFGRSWWGNVHDVPYDYPLHIRDELPQDGRHELYMSYAEFVEPASHPWTADPHALEGWQTGDFYESLTSQISFNDLRAYLALFADPVAADGAEASGLVVYEVRPIDIVAPLNSPHQGIGSAIVDRWPISRIDLDWRNAIDPKLHMVIHVPNPSDLSEFIAQEGAATNELAASGPKWAIWIGSAHSDSEAE